MTLTFTLPLPPSANNLFVNVPGRGRVKSAEYRKWITDAGWLAKTAIVGAEQVKPPYQVTYEVPADRRRDLDNFSKATGDLLVRLAVIADDKFIDRLIIERADRKDMLVKVETYRGAHGIPLKASVA